MITRIRIEAKGDDKDKLIGDLVDAVGNFLDSLDQSHGHWECTQDVISGKPGNYQGRMVLVYNNGNSSH